MSRTSRFVAAALAVVGVTAALAPVAAAQSVLPVSPPGVPQLENQPVAIPQIPGVPPLPVVTVPVVGPVRPTNEYGSVHVFPNPNDTVGVAEPIMFTFDRPITDRARAEATLGVRTSVPVAGKFYWISDTEVRWRPLQFWPAHTTVSVYAGGFQENFTVGDAFVSTYDDNTHLITVTRDGQVVRTMRASTGAPGWDTYNGIYYTGQRGHDVEMNSTTFGLRIEDGGYDAIVHDAIRLTYDGIYIHSAPWSLDDQGVRDVSNGCINISPDDAAWYYANSQNGDPIIVSNTHGRPYGAFDGQGDWNY